MRKLILLSLTVLFAFAASAQDLSNKGKEFWLVFPAHVPSGASQAQMGLFLTSDKNSTGTITVNGFSTTFTVTANQITGPIDIPYANANVTAAESNTVVNKGIHVKTDPGQPAVVLFAHIYAGFRSEASLILPKNTLSRKYYSMNFWNAPTGASRSQFQIVAAESGGTTVQIQIVKNGVASGAPFTITLPNEGDVYQYQPPENNVDITGSYIESIPGPLGECKKIAVFSGSSAVSISRLGCNGGSFDPLFQQCYPITTWGKEFGVVPLLNNTNGYHLRVMASENNTNVDINGTVVTLNAGQYYPATNPNPIPYTGPQVIVANKPIAVAQYLMSANCAGSTPIGGQQQGDPDMIILNPVEQNISDINIFSSNLQNINTKYLCVYIKNAGTASFRINGAAPLGTFIPMPQLNGYSYLVENLTGYPTQSFRLTSDSGFNAITYGMGNAESYGYSAGTNVKDLYQQILIQSQYGIESTPSVCTGSPFKFKVSLPYCADSLAWNLSGLPGPPPAPPTQIYTTCVPGPGGPDSTTVVNGKTIYWYSLPTAYTFSTIGLFPVTITAYAPNIDGCGSEQEIDFELQVSAPPVPDFSWTAGKCVAEPYQFTETTPQIPKATYAFWWDFGDPASGAANNSTVRNPQHTFTAPGTYTVRYTAITTPGCLTDTVSHTVTVEPLPSAIIDGANTVCINSAPDPSIVFTGSGSTAPYTFYYNINGGPALSVNSNPPNGISATITAPTNTAGTYIYTLDSVRTVGSTLCINPVTGQQITITITPDATVTLTSAAGTNNQTVCINNPIANITYAVGGSGTGGSVTGLPAGVTGSFAAGVITITGTPTVAGIFNYTVNTTGPCVTPTATGTITVTADATLALTSAAGTDNQTICINTLLTNITYAVGGTGTGGTVTGLPAGITGTFAAGVITISGTPTVAGTFNYTVNTTGPCVIPTATGTITVTPDATLALSSAAGTDNQTVCINIPITNITYAVGGSGNGGSVTGLPAGVTGTYAAGVITITGTPTAAGVFPYTVNTTGPCVTPSLGGTITVTADATITLTSTAGSNVQNLCLNTPLITNITYVVAGSGTGATVTGLPAGITGVFAGGIVTISGTPTAAGVFNYTVTTTGPCVNPVLTGTITVYALPTPNFSFSTPSCETRVVNFTDLSVPNSGTVNSWTWDFGDGSPLSNVQNPSHVFALAGTYNVTLSVGSSFNCTNAAPITIPVTINDRPEAGFILPEVCLSDTYAQFIDTSKIAAGTITAWNWNFGDPASGPLNTSTLQNPQHSYTAVGNYNVELIVTSALGCRDTIVQVLTVNGSFPVANFTVNNPTTLCANDSVAIVEASTVFPGVITKVEIYWDNVNFPAVFDIDNSPFTGKVYKHLYPNFQAPLTRVFTIRYRAYSGGVCVNDRLANITVNAAPLVQFNAMPDACYFVPPFQITQASETGGVPGTGVYTGPGVSPTGIFNPAAAGIGVHTILYTYTSATGGCVDTMSSTIRVLDTAIANFTYVSPICQTTPASFTDVSTAPSSVVLANTVWDFGDGSPIENHAPGSTFTHLFPAPGNYTVTMYNVSAYGCNSRSTSQVVTVNPDHTISLNPGSNDNQTLCINTLIAPIVYTLGGGATNATVTGLPAGVTYTVAGTTLTIQGTPATTAGSPFNYSITTTGNTCLVANATGRLTVNPDHTITLNAGSNINQSVCVNSAIAPITYTLGGGASGATVTGLPAGVIYTVTGNTLTISGTPTTTIGGPTFNYTVNTTGNGCIVASAAGSIKSNPYPVPAFAVDKPTYCIPNAIVKFNNSSVMPDGSGMTYLWDFGEPSSGAANTSSGVSPTHWYASEGPFNVRLTVTSTAALTPSGVGCAHDTVIAVTNIHPQPKADFTINKPGGVCIGDDVTFTDNTDGKDGIVNQWFWDMGDGSIRNSNTVTYTYTDTITFSVKLYAVNSFGCNSDTITKLFTVHPYPHVNAGPDRFILEGGQIVLAPVVWGNDMQFVWTPNQYLIDNRIEKVKVNKPLTDMIYTLTVTARGGCSRSDDMFVKLLKFPKIPNTFTPNGDGINDKWYIDYLNTYPDNRVQVFTRTGQLVFESRGYNTPWDGTIKGKPLPFDTYYYIIEPGNGRDPLTGYVTIIK